MVLRGVLWLLTSAAATGAADVTKEEWELLCIHVAVMDVKIQFTKCGGQG